MTRNGCVIHGQPTYAHILACAHKGTREVWLSDQGDGTCVVYGISDIAARERAYDALDAWTASGEGGFDALVRLDAEKKAVERTSEAVDHETGRRLCDAAVAALMAG